VRVRVKAIGHVQLAMPAGKRRGARRTFRPALLI
jgi:hypothetical protein